MPLRVGWVDDTGIVRALAVRVVERSGHACSSFPRHADLLDADLLKPFDVVVLQPEDLLSPRLTRQRLLERGPRLAIAIASGHSIDRLRETLDLSPAAFDNFIPKPFDPHALTAWLQGLELLDGSSAALAPATIRVVPVAGLPIPPAIVPRRRPLEVVV